MPWTFIKSAVKPSDWAKNTGPEVCFIGRSNVGKSTLINALANQNGLAYVSRTPGRTQTLNFFNVGNNKVVVDLPGYGYAKLNIEQKKEIANALDMYFTGRRELRKVFLLIDSKVGPTKDDELMISYLQKLELPITIIVTKIDKATQSIIVKNTRRIAALGIDFIATSSKRGTNIAYLRKVVDAQF